MEGRCQSNLSAYPQVIHGLNALCNHEFTILAWAVELLTLAQLNFYYSESRKWRIATHFSLQWFWSYIEITIYC